MATCLVGDGARGEALLVSADHLDEACTQVVDVALVGLAIGRLDDHLEIGASPHPAELVLEGHEAGAVAREQLEQVRVWVAEDPQREEPGNDGDDERCAQNDERPFSAEIDQAHDGALQHRSSSSPAVVMISF